MRSHMGYNDWEFDVGPWCWLLSCVKWYWNVNLSFAQFLAKKMNRKKSIPGPITGMYFSEFFKMM